MRRARVGLVFVAGLLLVSACFGVVTIPQGKTAYVVALSNSELQNRVTSQLTTYLTDTLHKPAKVVAKLRMVPPQEPAILLTVTGEANPLNAHAPEGSPEGFSLITGKANQHPLVVAVGSTDRGLKRAIQKLVLESQQSEGGLQIPDLQLSESPWIPQREWTLCPWVPWNVRATYVNPTVDQRVNVFKFPGPQLSKYAEMLDWFGYSGAQLIDAELSWSYFGSIEAYQDKLKELAKYARQNGQDVTLWVWAAEFNHYGWVDPDMVYASSDGHSAFEDPVVRRGFEKYYDAYADMAPHVDRLIGHFYDPGELSNREDVFKYMRLLGDKFKAKNPYIKLSIDLPITRIFL